MGAALGLIGPALSIGGSLFGLFGGNQAPTYQQPFPQTPAYQYQSMPTADQAFTSGVQGLQSTTSPLAASTLQSLYNNPGIPGAIAGGNVAGGLGEAAGLTQFGTGMSEIPYATQALQTGFDPLNQVYNQQFQQQTDQTRALEAARGIAMTPYGAGVEAQADINFNNQWQQYLQQRQQMGAQTAEGLYNQGVGNITGAPGTYYGGATMPYNTAQTIGTNQYGALTGYQGIQQTPLMDWMNYLQQGTGAQQAATSQYGVMANAQLAAQQQQFNQQQAYGKALGTGIQGLSTAWNKMPGQTGLPGTSGSPYYGPVAPG